MEFGIFSQMHVPSDETEHSRYNREIEVSLAVDAAGFKYNWSPEHHFLENYSHQPAPEVFLSFVAARAPRIHVGHAIVNITAPVNHPARVAERIATLDLVSKGRVEWGTGESSARIELEGYGVDVLKKREAWQEAVRLVSRADLTRCREALRKSRVLLREPGQGRRGLPAAGSAHAAWPSRRLQAARRTCSDQRC